VTRRGNPPEIVTALLELDARDKTFFEHREKLDVLAARMTTPIRTVSVSTDDEHNTYSLDVEDRSHGYPRVFHFGVEFVSSGEYRTLAAAYREIQEVTFPVVVRALTAAVDAATEEAGADEAVETGARRPGGGRPRHPWPQGSRRDARQPRRVSSSSSSPPARRAWP
jgi:hypothetical protein